MTFRVDRTLAKRILKLAYPVTVAMLTQTAINLVDTIMVGRLPSQWSVAGQSAIAISLILLWAVGGLIASISVGTQALTARRVGEGSPREAGRVLNNAAALATALALVATVGVILALPAIYPWLHADPTVVKLGVEYSTYRFLGMVSMALTIVYKGFFDGIGRTKVHMNAAIVMNVVNVVLNSVLIFGLGPFPKMYVGGAGLASLIATFVGLGMMILYSVEGDTRTRYGLFARRTLSWKVTRSVAKLGIPGGLATLFVMTGFGAFIVIVGRLDMAAVREAVTTLPAYAIPPDRLFAANPRDVWTPELHHSIVSITPVYTAATKAIMDTMSIIFMTSMAFGQATATLVGQSLGARNPALAERYGWESAKIGAYIMGSIGLVIMAFPDAISSVFNPDQAVVTAGHSAMRLMGSSGVLIAFGMILAQALFGAGNTLFVMVAEMVLHFCCLIPIAYLLGIHWDLGLVGVWGAALLYMLLLATVMGWKFRQGGWKHITI